jgi:hypothetical protein
MRNCFLSGFDLALKKLVDIICLFPHALCSWFVSEYSSAAQTLSSSDAAQFCKQQASLLCSAVICGGVRKWM